MESKLKSKQTSPLKSPSKLKTPTKTISRRNSYQISPLQNYLAETPTSKKHKFNPEEEKTPIAKRTWNTQINADKSQISP